ncbi:hypothetical protein [Salinigranum marinum]|uniref:hypothetical protein n=1 Tax=Salinigranum marinum TaxID=1515595 RepID=UPI003CCE3F67
MFVTGEGLIRGSRTDGGTDAGPLRIDRQLPEFQAVSRRHVVVDAAIDETYDAMRSADLARLGSVVGTLGALRTLPTRVAARLAGTAATPDALTLADLPSHGTWIRLDEADGEEFVFGAVGTVWKPRIEWVELGAEEFRTFEAPGYAKIAAGLSVRPYGRDRTLLTYEARTAGTDPSAERRFGRYWWLVAPFVGYILGRVLARIKVDAETAATTRRRSPP